MLELAPYYNYNMLVQTNLDFLNALSVLAFLIWLTNQELKILTLYSISAILTSLKTPFLSRLLSFFCLEFVYKGKDGLRLSCKKINILIVFCRNCVGGLLVWCVF
jgi:hypothetical protein